MSSSKEKPKRVGVCADTTGYKRRNSGASIYRSIPRHAGHGCRQLAVWRLSKPLELELAHNSR